MSPFVFLFASSLKKSEDDCACEGVPNLGILLSSKRNKICEEDCACSNTDGLVHERLQLQRDAPITISLNSEYQIFMSVGANPVVVNSSVQRVLDAFFTPRTLEQARQEIDKAHTEHLDSSVQQLVSLGFLHTAEDCACTAEEDCGSEPVDTVITAWLHLTDRCNLRCSYCYLPHVREDMTLETGRAAVDATFRSAIANNFKQVKLKYAGGEPLLQFPLIVELHRYAQSLAEKRGMNLEGVVLSNGTLLTAEMVEALKLLGLRLMISLDGLGQYHDSHRPYAGGRGSFADVSEAVDLALANGLTPNISITVSSRTAEGLPEVVAWILNRNLPFSLNFYRENELSASHEDMRLDEEKIINGMLSAFKVIENNLPRRPFLGGIVDRANLSAAHTHTCGVGQSYLVFDQNGQVAKCQMHIRKPVTNVHAADPLTVIRADRSGIQNVSVEEKEGCKSCEWKHWCAGGCPLETYRATGRYDVKSPNCNIYKALFPEALRLEGLRLIKYQDDPEVVVKC